MGKEVKIRGKLYSPDECRKAAKECNSVEEFNRKYSSYYLSARYHDIMSEFTWFRKRSDNIKYTEEYCFSEAKKYNTLYEFIRGSRSAYNKACKKGWLSNYSWLSRSYNKLSLVSKFDPRDRTIWCVYVYIINDTYAYIGLTMDIKRRHEDHRIRKKDTLFRFCSENNFELPEYTIIKSGLNAEEAQILENNSILEYSKRGYIIINSGKTGIGSGSLGSFIIKWDEKTCQEAALQCKTKREFKERFPRARHISIKLGIYKTFTWLSDLPKRKTRGYEVLDKSSNFIKSFNSPEEVFEFLGNKTKSIKGKALPTPIYMCLRGERSTAYGYIWRYKN